MELEAGRDVAVPYDAPLMLEELARAFGRRVRRYYDCPAGRDDEDARRLASGQLWARDGLMMAVKLLAYLKESGASLAGLAARLPGFAVATKTIPCDGNPGRVLRQLAEGGEPVEAGEGARIRLKKGTLLVRPSKRGKRLTLTAEAPDTETAAELCGELEEKLRTVFLDMSNETK